MAGGGEVSGGLQSAAQLLSRRGTRVGGVPRVREASCDPPKLAIEAESRPLVSKILRWSTQVVLGQGVAGRLQPKASPETQLGNGTQPPVHPGSGEKVSIRFPEGS